MDYHHHQRGMETGNFFWQPRHPLINSAIWESNPADHQSSCCQTWPLCCVLPSSWYYLHTGNYSPNKIKRHHLVGTNIEKNLFKLAFSQHLCGERDRNTTIFFYLIFPLSAFVFSVLCSFSFNLCLYYHYFLAHSLILLL